MARTEAFRALGGFDARFRRCAELDLAVRAALNGAHFISVDAPLVTQYLTPTADKGGNADLRYRLLLLEKHGPYLKQKRSYVGAWCYMHAQFYCGRHWRWRLWYLAALVFFPWRVSRERLRQSSLLARLRLVQARAAAS
jgi:GT2 family glycosyltransferase